MSQLSAPPGSTPPATKTDGLEQGPEITHAPVTGFVIGVVAGVGSALLGIGGGLIMVPAMVWMLRIRQHRAVGTSLAVILPTAIIAAYRYQIEAVQHQEPGLNAAVTLWLAIGGVFGAQIGATVANLLKARQLKRLFGCFVMLVGGWMIARTYLHPQSAVLVTNVDFAHSLQMVGIGLLVGIVSGLMGVGGGLVMVPALALLMGYGQRLAQGTSLAVIIPVSISGALVHWRKGNIVWGLVTPLSLGAALAAWLTAGVVFNIPQDTLRIVFGGFLMLVGFGMTRPSAPRPSAVEPPVR